MITALRTLFRELKWHKNEYFIFLVSLIIPGTIGILSLHIFLNIAENLQHHELVQFDNMIFEFIHNLRSPSVTAAVIFITDLGDLTAYCIMMPAIAVLLYYRGHHRWKLSLQALIVLASASLLNVIIKEIISRPRPLEDMRLVVAHSYSFPSGHSMSAIAFYGFAIYLSYKYIPNKFIKVLLIVVQALLILSIGLSRVYLGVHYPTDVVAGFIGGLFWLILCIAVFNFVNLYRERLARKRRLYSDSNH